MAHEHANVVPLTFLLYPCEEKPGRFVAHCLELDVVAVERNRPRAILLLKELIEDLLEAAVKDDALEKVFRPAPQQYWRMLAHSTRYIPPKKVERRHIASAPVKRVDYAYSRSRSYGDPSKGHKTRLTQAATPAL